MNEAINSPVETQSRTANLRHAFSNVEMLVVLAIIVVLVSLLLPTVSSARRQAKAVQCSSNLRQIGSAINMYCLQYNGVYPYAYRKPATATTYSVVLGWDDLISGFDGREGKGITSKGLMSATFQGKTWTGFVPLSHWPKGFFNGRERLYQCPSDMAALRNYTDTNGSPAEWKTYGINANFDYNGTTNIIRGISGQWGYVTVAPFSVKIMMVRRPSDKLLLGEMPGPTNYLGQVGFGGDVVSPINLAGLVTNGSTGTWSLGLHGKYTNNFLFCDGHVSTGDIRLTAPESTRANWYTLHESQVTGMWKSAR